MSFSTILFTEKGRALQAKASAGKPLLITKIKMGSGSLSGQSQITLIDLIEPKVVLNISEIKTNTNFATVKGIFNNSDIATGFYWREIGIFANDPDIGEILYCYGNAGALAEYIPPSSNQIIEKLVSLSIVVGDAANVSAVIDESLVFATKAEFNEVNNKADTILNNTTIFETAGGTGSDITLTNIVLEDGYSKTFIASTNNNGSATTINGKQLYKPGTTKAPNLVAGKAVTVWYDLAGDCFFIKASGEGTAQVGDVLAGKTFTNDNDTFEGTMPDNGPAVSETINLTSNNQEYTISKGFHSGLRKIKAAISGLVDNVIKANTTVGGITGTYTSDATAADSDVLSGKTYYRNGIKGTGSIPNKAAAIITPGTADQTIGAGQYLSGAQTIKGEPKLLPGNIPADMNFFGVQGNRALGKKYATGTSYSTFTGTLVRYHFQNPGWNETTETLKVINVPFIPSVVKITIKAIGTSRIDTYYAGQGQKFIYITIDDLPISIQAYKNNTYQTLINGTTVYIPYPYDIDYIQWEIWE